MAIVKRCPRCQDSLEISPAAAGPNPMQSVWHGNQAENRPFRSERGRGSFSDRSGTERGFAEITSRNTGATTDFSVRRYGSDCDFSGHRGRIIADLFCANRGTWAGLGLQRQGEEVRRGVASGIGASGGQRSQAASAA